MINATEGEDRPQCTEALETETISDNVDKGNKSKDNKQDNNIVDQPKRTANIFRDNSGDPKGAAVWLNTSELDAAGVDVDDADAVGISIEDGNLELVSAGGDENE